MSEDQRSSRQSGKTSRRRLRNGLYQAATTDPIEQSFDEVILPHLDAAYRLARRLLRKEHDADDVVQDASLRAFRYFRTFGGGDGRAWFLRIVRNSCFGWRGHQFEAVTEPFDEQQHRSVWSASDPETLLLQSDDATLIARALRALPDRLHQPLVLRELEGLSYRELADVMGIPIGTVMSRLSRARQALRGALDTELNRPAIQRGRIFENRRLTRYWREPRGRDERNGKSIVKASAIPAA
jgi:RNA polymerase sigma-70 factor, ECF subfamily